MNAGKVISFALSLVISVSSSITAFAITEPEKSGKSDIDINIEPSNFDATVPLNLPIYLHSNGLTTTATDAKIENNSQGPIIIKNVKLTPADNWKLASFTDNYKIKKVNSKELGFQIMNENVLIDGSVDMQVENWPSIPGNGNLPLNYNSKIPARNSDGTMITASLEFTLDWDKINRVHQSILRYGYKGLDYNLNEDGTASVSDRNDVSGDVVISDTVVDNNGATYKVTKIGDWAFYNCYSLKNITIPDSIDTIGSSAFFGCDDLTNIQIPDSVTSLGFGAFNNCISLENIVLPDSITSIPGDAFIGCSSLKNINVSDFITHIGDTAFIKCTNLKSITVDPDNKNYASVDGVLFNKDKTELISYPMNKTENSYTIPNSVTFIREYAFYECSNLTNIEIPDSVVYIDSDVFSDCDSLTNIVLPDSVTFIGSYSFSNCDNLKNVTISNSITYIEEGTFRNCTSLNSINIGDSIVSIGTNVFNGCNSLTAINVGLNNQTYSSENGVLFNKDKTELIMYPAGKTDQNYIIPDSVITVGEDAFYECKNITNITIQSPTKHIYDYAFAFCYHLTNITIPNSIVYIGDDAFTCDDLTNITIPDSVTYIGEEAFENCNSIGSITIPDSVNFVGDSAFGQWTSNQTINIKGKTSYQETLNAGWSYIWDMSCYAKINYAGVTEYKYNGINYHIYDKGTASVSKNGDISGNVNISSTVIDDNNVSYTVTSIEKNAFSLDDNLTGITIPDSVTSIGENAFSDCSNLTNIKIGNSVVSVDRQAFEFCSSLTDITIPDSVTSIGDYAFGHCNALTSITIPDSVTHISDFAFDYWKSNQTINIKGKSSFQDTMVARWGSWDFFCDAKINYWGNTPIEDLPPDYSIAVKSDGTLSVTKYVGTDTKVTIPEYINDMKVSEIANMSSYQKAIFPSTVTSIIIPKSIKIINDNAFYGCSSLTDITIPDSVTSIGISAFEKCDSLTNIIIPDSVVSIGDNTFISCPSLTNVNVDLNNENYSSTNGILFNKDKTTLIKYPEGKTNTAYTIPDSVTSIDTGAFYNVQPLTNIEIPDSVISIGNYAFYNCKSLLNVSMSNSLTSIGELSFYNCKNLLNIEIPGSVTFVDYEAFKYWDPDQTINIEGKLNYDDTVNAGWDEYWDYECYAQIDYMGSIKTSASLMATTEDNYQIINWTDENNKIISENTSLVDTSIGNIDYTVHFKKDV